MDLNSLRERIDDIDNKLISLFHDRMEVAKEIAEYKKENNLEIYDSQRERKKLLQVMGQSDEALKSYMGALYSLMFELSRSYQKRIIHPESKLNKKIADAINETAPMLNPTPLVACQGIEGAYSQLACDKLFKTPDIMYFNTFDSVFSAIENGLCQYGVLPLENSTAGSVNRIYDLMMKYNFYIVRSVRLKIDHNLLVKKGVNFSEIKEIYSHEQAFSQCAEFLKSLGNVKITPVENTAVAAQMVLKSDRRDVAAISSRNCADIYGLDCAVSSIQDTGNNYTRFICISKNLEIYPGADKTSISMVIPHRPGSLYKVLARFFALSINLIKLESRPIPDRDFEFMFYFDLETSVYSDEFIQLIGELDSECEKFKYLGSYTEIF